MGTLISVITRWMHGAGSVRSLRKLYRLLRRHITIDQSILGQSSYESYQALIAHWMSFNCVGRKAKRSWNWRQYLELSDDDSDHLAYGTGIDFPEYRDDHSYASDSSLQHEDSRAVVSKARRGSATQRLIEPLQRAGRHSRLKSIGDVCSKRFIGKVQKRRNVSVNIKNVVKKSSELLRLRQLAALKTFKPQKLKAADQNKLQNGKRLKLLEVKEQKIGVTKLSALSQVWNHGSGFPSKEAWTKICPSGAHSCSFCRQLCIQYSDTGSHSEGQSQLFRYDQITAAADGRCIVFSWLRQLLSVEGQHSDSQRYFRVSLVPDQVFLESNNSDEFDFTSHGYLGAYSQDWKKDSGPPLNIHVASEENFKQSRDWMQECQAHHPGCRESSRTKLPSRVLEIRDGATKVRLIETKREFEDKYAALSYCWGRQQELITTKASLTQWKKSIPVQHLPKTVQDAIITTSRLGLTYLWVDSLCILQPDPNDPNSDDPDVLADQMIEIPRMSDIYYGAYVTISAACAKICDDGFLYSRNPEIAAVPCFSSNGTLGVLNLYQVFGVVPEPIHRRAWTLQEHVQSSRILEYGTQQLRRICRGDPDNAKTLEHYDPMDKHYDPATSDKPLGSFNMNPRTILICWRRLVLDYTSREIKEITDRPLAIQAIAKNYGKLLHKDYFGGLWDLRGSSKELLWQRDPSQQPVDRPYNPSIPTWSWFSVHNTIIKWEEWPFDYSEVNCKVLDARVDRNIGYPTALPFSSILKVRGRLRKAQWKVGQKFLHLADGVTGQPVARILEDAIEAVDAPDSSEGIISVTTLEVLSEMKEAQAIGLVLSDHAASGKYRRVGLFWTSSHCEKDAVLEWWSAFKEATIFIV